MIEIHCKIFEEITLIGIIAITKHCFAFKELLVVFHFLLDVFELGVEFILFRFVGIVQVCISHSIKSLLVNKMLLEMVYCTT